MLAGCHPAPPLLRDANPGIDAADLLRGEPLTGRDDAPPLPDADLLGLDEPMRGFLARHVARDARAATRLRQLLDAVVADGGLGLAYGGETMTAAEAFHRREVDCLSFTSLFVALGREAGLDVRFQEVDIPPDWSRQGAGLVLNRHVDAVVRGAGPERVVDYAIEDFRPGYDRRVIDDGRALAHYYSNVGVRHLQERRAVEALRHFRKSIDADPAFAPAWINLGVLYLRSGFPDWAEAAFRQALAVAPREPVAASNLERLYRQQGRVAEADALRALIEDHRERNPYYRYYRAGLAFARGDYSAAIADLEVAAKARPGEDRFAALLGMSHLRNGDRRAAQRWFARAGEAATDEAARRAYAGKLEKLRAPGPG